MVYVPGGTACIGAERGDPLALAPEFPAFDAEVEPFVIDRSPVTVERYGAFVEATGFETQAEALGDTTVFDAESETWVLQPGASWRRPLGPGGPEAVADHPVALVSWNAAEFCVRDGKRLPTEIEWEHAAWGAVRFSVPYAWGGTWEDGHGTHTDAHGDGHNHANTWTGTFPAVNTEADGFRYNSPVGHFGETALGLTDMGGNVWEWTADWFRPYAERDRPLTPTAQSERAMRGGSFLGHADYCHGYRVSGRSHAMPESSLFHVGFRCATDLP